MRPDLLKYQNQLRINPESRELFDPVRKKYVAASPEEFVRQLLILFFNLECGFPINRMSAEKSTLYAGRNLRYDLAVHDELGNIWMLCELKAPEQNLNAEVTLQLSRYNTAERVPYLLICNGLDMLCWQWNKGQYRLCESLPVYNHSAY